MIIICGTDWSMGRVSKGIGEGFTDINNDCRGIMA